MRTTALHTAKRLFFGNNPHSWGCVDRLSLCLLVSVKCLAVFGNAYAAEPKHSSTRQGASQAARIDWTTMPSSFTHDVQGTRVDQFAQGVQPVVYERPDYQRSGFRHYRSSLQGGNSADHMHIVDQWGPSVRPYGEWRYPTRPFSVPYPAWGPQLPLTSVNSNFNNFNNQVQFPGNGGIGRPWQPGNPGQGGVGPGPGWNNQGVGAPSGWPYSAGGFGFGPAASYPGAYQYNPYAGGPNGFGQFAPGNSGVGQYGVGPANALRTDQDEYYQAAPEPPQLPDRDFFFSPAR